MRFREWKEEARRTGLGLGRLLIRFDPGAIRVTMALRNTVGLLVPLALGIAVGWPRAGLAVAGGALAASFSDGTEAYRARAWRMLTASVMVSLAMGAGVLSGANDWIAVGVGAIAAFGAGLAVSVSQRAGDIGTISLVWLAIYAGQGLPPERALAVVPLALIGALFQTGLSLTLWPFQPYAPERRALGELFLGLAQLPRAPGEPSEPVPASDVMSRAREALRNLRYDNSLAAVRYRAILSQAERVRLALIALGELRRRIDSGGQPLEARGSLRDFVHHSSAALNAIGQLLLTGTLPAVAQPALTQLEAASAEWHRRLAGMVGTPSFSAAVLKDALFQMDALAGQIRAALDLAAGATPEGATAFARVEARRPWRLRLGSRWATLRANLTFRSVAFRHAVRLSLCLGSSEALARALHWHRSYWIPMTVAIVLKPDFAGTMSRGLLRIAGELAGLLLATALFHWVPAAGLAQLMLVAAFMFLLRSVGLANFGVFSLSVSALVVLLIALRGEIPGDAILVRGYSTLIGGALALAAYAVWPTSERYRVRDQLASLLRAQRDYLSAVVARYRSPDSVDPAPVDAKRANVRLARSNLEASVQRWATEPGTLAGDIDRVRGMMASSLRVAHAIISLEAGQATSAPAPPRAEFQRFAADVEDSLSCLASAVEGAPSSPRKLPDLREDVRLLTLSGDAGTDRYALVNVQADRIANSINTLAQQVGGWRQTPSSTSTSRVTMCR